MTEVTNISGEFHIELAGKKRTLKANFGCIEALETQILQKGIFETLTDAMQNKGRFSDIVAVIHVGLVANKDTRLSRAEVGQAILDGGLVNFMETYIEFLTYCITGGVRSNGESSGE